MGMSSRSVPRLLLLLVAASWPLSACDSSQVEPAPSGPSASPETSPSDSPNASDGESSVREWRVGGDARFTSDALLASFSVERVDSNGRSRLVLTTHGSSSCPWRVRDVQATGNHSVTITVGSRRATKDRTCTTDDAKRRERLDLPVEVQAEEVTTARLITADGASHTASVATRPESHR